MKLILTILFFSFLQTDAQYVANWTGWGHSVYEVQQGLDSNNWITIGRVNGQLATANYQYTVPSVNYYYRIKADKDSTKAILIAEVLSIKTPPAKGKKTRIQNLSVKVSVGSQIHYTISSPRSEMMNYSLYDITGRKLREKEVFVHEGINEMFDEKPAVQGIYYSQFIGYFDLITTKIIR